MQERLSKLITAKSFWNLVLKAINFMTDNIIERKMESQIYMMRNWWKDKKEMYEYVEATTNAACRGWSLGPRGRLMGPIARGPIAVLNAQRK